MRTFLAHAWPLTYKPTPWLLVIGLQMLNVRWTMAVCRSFANTSKWSGLLDPNGLLSASISYAKPVRALPAAHERNLPQQEHTKLKSTKIYSKGDLVNHTNNSTNEIFSLYSVSFVELTKWILLYVFEQVILQNLMHVQTGVPTFMTKIK